MSKTEINAEQVDKGTVIAVAAVAVAVVGIVLMAVHRGPKDKKTASHDPAVFDDLAKRKPAGGRRVRRRDPRADGHATPMGGTGRVSSAPAFYSYK
ncbi:hypothetical protein [Cutibacterium sp.]|uniref:hypothetical protein n=1 Tax=Cutibacterium sp. TaxID=1912221 RepID=UPI0026DB757A|nr:hypothetical protein [Cutibacterium sp.]MDO4412655.1 hypothetical protein [Cutibacterium sp.]